MAARLLQRRLSHAFLFPKQPRSSSPSFLKAQELGLATAVRKIQTKIETKDKELEEQKSGDTSQKLAGGGGIENSAVSYTALSSLKTSTRHDLAMIFTCRVCETRSVKTVCRESYDKGVVVARCGGCNNLHLIADRLGWFGAPGSVEDFLAVRGEEVKKGSVDTLNLTPEDLAGTK